MEKEMATHSSVLAWRIPGTGEPGGLPSMGSHRVRHDWSDLAAAVCTHQSQPPNPSLPPLLISALLHVWVTQKGQAMCHLFGRPWSQKTETRGHEHWFLLSCSWFHHLLILSSLYPLSVFSLSLEDPKPELGLLGERLRACSAAYFGPELEADASLGRGFLSVGQLHSLRRYLHVCSHSLVEIKVILWLATASVPTCLLVTLWKSGVGHERQNSELLGYLMKRRPHLTFCSPHISLLPSLLYLLLFFLLGVSMPETILFLTCSFQPNAFGAFFYCNYKWVSPFPEFCKAFAAVDTFWLVWRWPLTLFLPSQTAC